MKRWATNVRKLWEEVIVPFRQVVWHMEGWNGRPVLYGDEQALFIFDPEKMKLHAFVASTYMCHQISEIMHDDVIPEKAHFHIKMADLESVCQMALMEVPRMERIRQLASECAESMIWLKKHEPN